MARAKKSSLDMDEPVFVQDEVFGDAPVVEEPVKVEPTAEPVVEKAVEKPAVAEKENKAEAQIKTVEKKEKRGVKICVI